jgi:hypothetical protein
VRIALKSKDPRIVPDMGVRVGFLGASGPAAPKPEPGMLVPAEAVRGDGASAVVFVVTGEKVERRSVTLGRAVGANRHVVSGLRDGERVVLAPPESLKDGDAIRLAEKS